MVSEESEVLKVKVSSDVKEGSWGKPCRKGDIRGKI